MTMTSQTGAPSRASTTIVVVAAALMSLGVVMVLSASASLTGRGLLDEPLRRPELRQAAFAAAALLVLLAVGSVSYERWRIRPGSGWQPAVALLAVAVVLCTIVLIPGIGTVRNGARRWLAAGPGWLGLGFQPSEAAKLALVVFLAAWSAWRGPRMRTFFGGLLPGLLVIGVLAALVGKEDFGTAVLLGAVGAGVLLASGCRVWQLALFAVPGVAGLAALIVMEPYRLERITGFLNIWDDPLGSGYHPVQSLITIASGGWWGVGLGAGVQKYGYLPEARSDFIFAVVCEELGLVGGAAVIALYFVLLWQARRTYLTAPDDLGRLLALGAALTIGLQAALNIAVVTVSVPTKGIALPFLSAGGSGVLLLGALVGILVNVARHRTRAELPG